jgi:hypothetical protein
MKHASIGMLITGVRKTPKICVGVAQLPSGPKILVLTVQPKRSGKPRTYDATSIAPIPDSCPFTLSPINQQHKNRDRARNHNNCRAGAGTKPPPFQPLSLLISIAVTPRSTDTCRHPG